METVPSTPGRDDQNVVFLGVGTRRITRERWTEVDKTRTATAGTVTRINQITRDWDGGDAA